MSTPDVSSGARALARRFIEAFNERDFGALREMIIEDAEFFEVDGTAMLGEDGLRAILLGAEDAEVKLVPIHEPEVEERDGDLDLRQPVRELIGPDDIERVAEFRIRDGHVSAFWVPRYDEA
jgi:ketosteroid isomerase-like protein